MSQSGTTQIIFWLLTTCPFGNHCTDTLGVCRLGGQPCDLHSQGVILVRQFVEQGNGGRRPGDGFCETDVDQSNGRESHGVFGTIGRSVGGSSWSVSPDLCFSYQPA